MMRIYLLRAKISLNYATILKYMQELGIRSTVVPQKPTYKKFKNHYPRGLLLHSDQGPQYTSLRLSFFSALCFYD